MRRYIFISIYLYIYSIQVHQSLLGSQFEHLERNCGSHQSCCPLSVCKGPREQIVLLTKAAKWKNKNRSSDGSLSARLKNKKDAITQLPIYASTFSLLSNL